MRTESEKNLMISHIIDTKNRKLLTFELWESKILSNQRLLWK